MSEGKIAALDSPENLKQKFGCTTVEEVFHKLAGGVL
jgi:hypothetical protein